MKGAGLVWSEDEFGPLWRPADGAFVCAFKRHNGNLWHWRAACGTRSDITGVAKTERGAKAAAVRALLRLVAAEKRAASKRARDVRKACGVGE